MGWTLVGREPERRAVEELLVGQLDGIAFVGGLGVGKSALLEAIAARAEELALSVHRIFGSPGSIEITFGAVAHLIPEGTEMDRLVLLRSLERVLVRSGSGGPNVVLVDDAHLLDGGTVTLLHTIAAERRAKLALTMSVDQPVPSALTKIWKDGLARRIDVSPLDRSTTRRMIESALAGPIVDPSEQAIWDLTAGHPLFVRAIVESASFERVGRRWRLRGDPLSASRILEPLQPTIDALSGPARQALAVLAMGAPLPAAVVDQVAGPDATAEIEDRGLVRTTDGRLAARHHLYGQAALRGLANRTRRSVSSRLAAAMFAQGPLDDADLVRAIGWRLDAGEPCDATETTRAAEIALSIGDDLAATRLSRAVCDEAPRSQRWQPAFVLAQALRQLGDSLAAEEAFAIASTAPLEADRVNVALARAQNLSLALGRFEEATHGLAALAGTIDDIALSRRLAVERTFLGSVTGDFRGVVASAQLLFDDPDTDPFTLVTVGNGLAFASVMLLRVDGLDSILARCRAAAEMVRAEFPMATDQLDLIDAVAHVAQGRIEDAIDMCRTCRCDGMDVAGSVGRGAWAIIEAFARSFRVDDTLIESTRHALVDLRGVDPLGLRYVGSGIAAVNLVQSGLPDEARAAVDAVSPPTNEGDRRVSILIEARVAAWQSALSGDFETANVRLADAGRVAVQNGHLLWGLLALHDAVRFGDAQATAPQIVELREVCTGGLMETCGAHAVALAGADPDALLEAAAAFVAIGATRLAAETAAQAGALLARLGDAVASRRAVACAQMLGGGSLPVTPMRDPARSVLTRRQAHVISLVLEGRTSRQVADHLSLSIRTVENHVAKVFRVVEASSRAELASVLGLEYPIA